MEEYGRGDKSARVLLHKHKKGKAKDISIHDHKRIQG